MYTEQCLQIMLLAQTKPVALRDQLINLGCIVHFHTLTEWLEISLYLEEIDLILIDLTGTHTEEELRCIQVQLSSAPVPVVLVIDENIPIDWHSAIRKQRIGLIWKETAETILESTIGLTYELFQKTCINQKLTETIDQLSEVSTHIPIGVFSFCFNKGRSFKTEFVSKRNTTITGISHEQENDHETFIKIIIPEDRQKFIAEMEKMIRVFQPVQIQVRAIVHGQMRTLLLRFNPTENKTVNSEFTYFCYGTIEDITEASVESERRDRIIEFMSSFKQDLDSFHDLLLPAETLNDQKKDLLSDREREVYNLLRTGLSNAEIGKQLYISESTLKKHVCAIYKKMDVTSRAEFMALVL